MERYATFRFNLGDGSGATLTIDGPLAVEIAIAFRDSGASQILQDCVESVYTAALPDVGAGAPEQAEWVEVHAAAADEGPTESEPEDDS